MKLIKLRPHFWINPDHVTNAWIDTTDHSSIKFQLSSDADGTENVLREPEAIAAFCAATGIDFPTSK